MHDTKICLLGGDTRQYSLANHLAASGYETAVWGIPILADTAGNTSFGGVKCSDPRSAAAESRAVILPLPASRDGVRINCMFSDDTADEFNRELRLTELMEILSPGTLLLAGMPGDVLKTMARDANIKLIDYYDCEEVQIKNAIPTAEGAVALALEALPVTLYGASVTVVGYGRISQRLAAVLHALGARITVAARSLRDLTWAGVAGYTALPMQDFLNNPGAPDVLFNTVPAPILSETVLTALPPSTLIIELASAPGGIDPGAARTAQQKIIRAPSLPGRVAPFTAGKILFETIRRLLIEEGVVPE